MAKIKILVAYDHAVMRDGIRALLSLEDDMEIVGEASDGKEAIQKAEEIVPDVIIMEIAMPGIDGIEATRCVVKGKTRVKVIILTQHDNKEYVLSALKAGAAGYVCKRVLGSELKSAIRTVYSGGFFLCPSAIAILVESYQHQVAKEPYDCLTARERGILNLIVAGHTSREIADMLSINLKTILSHRTNIMRKLDLHRLSELIKFAMRKGLTSINT